MSLTGLAASYNTLQDYQPPPWAEHIKNKPSKYVQLAMQPTPIHSWSLPGLPGGVQVSVKRDDLTGCLLSGNKVRKLEFLLADALEKGCDSVITCGGIHSNHSRTTAVAARQLGLKPHLLLRWDGKRDPKAVGCRGNVLLNRCVGAKIILVPNLQYVSSTVDGSWDDSLEKILHKYAEKVKAEGAKPYVVPLGGSNEIGEWGYFRAFQEMLEQGVAVNFDDVILPVGSAGTVCGLAVANYLTGSKLKIHAVRVATCTPDYIHGHIDEFMAGPGLTTTAEGKSVQSRDIVDIIDGYQGGGYGVSTKEELAQLMEISTTTGVALDPVYTLKGVRGMLSELKNNPGRFRGKRVLYLHTGGAFGLFDGRMEQELLNNPATNEVYDYKDLISGDN